MSRPSEDSLILASIALIELADARSGSEAEALRDVADYLLRLSSLQALEQDRNQRVRNELRSGE